MSYDELVAMSIAIQQAISNKRDEAMKEVARAYQMALALGITEEEMKAYFSTGVTSQETTALPETTREPEEVTPIEEQVSTPEPATTPVEKTEEELTSMEELLSNDPEYKEYYAPKHPEKKSDRALSTMDELLSGEPINRILCLGNEVPDDKAYKQHYRISHVDGIIPTETATGQTIIYIPPVAA